MQATFLSAIRDGLAQDDDGLSTTLRLDHKSDAGSTPCLARQMARSIIASSKKVILTRDRVCHEGISSEGRLHIERGWDDDFLKLTNLFNDQKKITKRQTKQLLHKKGDPLKESMVQDAPPIGEEYAWASFAIAQDKGQRHSDDSTGQSWAVAANHAQRGVRSLVNYIAEYS